MMMTPISSNQTSLQRRLIRRVVPAVVLAAVVIGLLGVFSIRSGAYDNLRAAHTLILEDTTHRISEELQGVADDLIALANENAVRQFAAEAPSAFLQLGLRTNALSRFLDWIETHPDDFIALRFIDSLGRVRAEVANTALGTEIVETRGVTAAEALYVDALVAPAGQVFLASPRTYEAVTGETRLPRFYFTVPVYPLAAANTALGVLQLEVDANRIFEVVVETETSPTTGLEGRHLLILNNNNEYLADSAADSLAAMFVDLTGAGREFSPSSGLRSSREEQDLDQFLIANPGNVQIATLGNRVVSAHTETFFPAPDAPWRVVLVDDAGRVLGGSNFQALVVFAASLALGVGGAFGLTILLRREITPLERATELAQQLAHAEGQAAAIVNQTGDPLTAAVVQMAERIKALSGEMEQQRERLRGNLQIAARIGREAALQADQDVLLNRVINLICAEYHFQHAQIFMVDEIGHNAILAYSHGEAGQAFLEQDIRLPVRGASAIGRAISTRRLFVDDAPQAESGNSAVLAGARSRLVLPLFSGEGVIGALDIQSTEAQVFQMEDLQAFELLADQVGIALYNIRLLEQSEERVQQINTLNRELTRSAWEGVEEKFQLESGYHYDLRSVQPGAVTPPEAVSMPITLRGQVIGSLDIATPEGGTLSTDEQLIMQAVTERVALAIDRARLFQETQLSLSETSLLYDLSRRINEATRLEEIIEAIIVSVMPGAIGGQIMEFDDYPQNSRPIWLTVTSDWYASDHLRSQDTLLGLRIHMPDHPLLSGLTGDAVWMTGDLEKDLSLDAFLSGILTSIGARAMVIIPLTMRAVWRGLITIQYPEPRRFTPQDQRIFTALIDQAGVAIDNSLLLRQTEATLDLRERMYAASRAVNTSQNIEDLLSALVATAENPNLNFSLSLLEGRADEDEWPQRERVVARSLDGLVTAANEIYPLTVALDSPWRERRPLIVDAGTLDEKLLPWLDRLRDWGQHYAAIFPLFSTNRPMALLYMMSGEPYEMSAEDYEFYISLTGQISTVLQNRRLLDQTAAALEETSRLYAASRAISSAPNLTLVYTAAVEHLAEASAITTQIMIFLAVPERSPQAPYLEYGYVWRWGVDDRGPMGERVARESVPYAHLVQNQPGAVLVRDVERDLAGQPVLRNQIRQDGTASIVATPLRSRQKWFGLLVCASDQPGGFDEQYMQFVQTVGDQIALAVENYDLIRAAEGERETLSSILDSMPSGVLVLDAKTYLPLHTNRQIERLLGQPISATEPFSAAYYNLYRTGTQLHYADSELPIFLSSASGDLAFADDIVVLQPDGSQVDLLLNAAPIREPDGSIGMIVAAFENISSLRGLENALQDNLRETIALYEATRALSDADEVDNVLDVIVAQLAIVEPYEAAVVLLDDATQTSHIARTLMMPADGLGLPAEVFHYRHYVWTPDVNAADTLPEEARAELLAQGIQAVGTMPLRTRGRDLPLGWLVTMYSEPHEFTAEDERFLTTLSDSAATTLDNRYLFQRTENALQEASVLYQASRVLFESNEPKDVLRAVVDHLLYEHTTHAFIALISLSAWDAPGTIATVAASWNSDELGVDLEGVSLTAEQFPAWRLLSSPEMVFIEDAESDDRLDELEKMSVASLGARSLVIMPLRATNRAIGAIWIGSPEPHRYNERELRVYQAFAEQSSISLEAAHLFEQAERRAGQLQTSAQVSQFASSILDLDILLPRLVELIRSAFQYDHVQIFLMDREDRFAILRASTGDAGKQLLAIRHRLEKGSTSVIGQVTAHARPVVALDTGLADTVHKPNPYLPHTRSEMALPLIIKGKVVGALDVQSNRANAFTDEDVAVLTTLAAQISVAIDNARLFEQAERRASDMSLLFAVTTAAASAESLADALQNVANDLRDSLNALSIGIYLPVAYIDEISGDTLITMRATATAGYHLPLSHIPEIRVGDTENVIGIAAENSRSKIINKVEDEPFYRPLVADAQSAVVVPLSSASQIVGLITMENAHPYAYNHETLTLLQTMGGTLTALIQNQQLLEKLQQTNEQLLEIDRLKSEFLANMSHELRTPLNSIIGFSRVILKGIDGPLTEMQEQDLTTIYNSGQHLLNLINDILDQAKIAAGKMEIKPDYFDIKPLVEGVRSIGIGLVKDKPIEIKVDIESGLPQVYGDEFRTRQVLLNLLSNASKFTQQGAITVSVYRSQHTQTGQPMVRVDVNDTGIGIAEKDIPLLFEAFRQVDSSLTRTAGGTGLGLPISKSLIELQGGEMLVHSQVNVGSTFSVTIPLDPPSQVKGDTGQVPGVVVAAQDEDTLKIGSGSSNGASHTNEAEKRRTNVLPAVMPTKRQVLVIEDNPDRVDQFRRIIQRQGFDVFAASIPLEAEAMASGLHPSVIVMDVNFAGGAGWDILRKLKERDDTFDIPVVVVTLNDEREPAMEAGAFAFLQHPIVPEDLSAAVLEAEQDSNTERILIIDDQPESTRLLKQLLDEYGRYRVFAAHNGSEGVSMVARRRPDLVLLDLRMPEMDGFAVLQELRSNPETSNIPVLVVTGDTLNASEQNQLNGIDIMYKTDISLENSEQFIQDVQVRLSRNGE